MTRRPTALSGILIACALAITACAAPQSGTEQAAAVLPAGTAGGAAMQEAELPPDAAGARARLAASPRHGEWAMIETAPGDSIRAWVVYPERSTPAPVVLVVHEIFGVTAWIRSVADQLAADGFIAIAPDLMTAHDVPAGDDGDPVREQATAVIRGLDPDVYHPQLRAIADWGMALPAATDRYGIVGFCWGGSASFAHAVVSPDVAAAVVYYGGSPATEQLHRINAPVLGLYAGDDARVNATVPPAEAEMRRLNRSYEVHMFDGAGHGFLRQQDGRDGANMAASRGAWPLTVAFFARYLGRE